MAPVQSLLKVSPLSGALATVGGAQRGSHHGTRGSTQSSVQNTSAKRPMLSVDISGSSDEEEKRAP